MASANVIPDHLFRLGSCGAGGPPCEWDCLNGVGSCSNSSSCELDATQSFAGVLSILLDDAPCNGGDGVVMMLGLTGTTPDGTPFELTNKIVDLCDHSILCSGRDNRDCTACANGDTGCCPGNCTQDTCAPGDAIFLCKDPCFGPDGFLDEADINQMLPSLQDTRRPLLELWRNELAAYFPAATGRPVIVDAGQQTLNDAPGTPTTRLCVTVHFLREDVPLGVCDNDATVSCRTDNDCDKGDCGPGTPPEVNPAARTTRVSDSLCSGATRAGLPCVTNADCGGDPCLPFGFIGTGPDGACSVSADPCVENADCTGVGETCEYCQIALCGNGSLDPGEDCESVDDSACPGQCGFDCRCPFTGCPTVPRVGCETAAKSSVAVKKNSDAAKDSLKWKTSKTTAFSQGPLADPVNTTIYALCIYDETANIPALVGSLTIDPNGSWTSKAPKGFSYKDTGGLEDGVIKVQLKTGADGKGKAGLSAKGSNPNWPAPISGTEYFDLDGELTVQLINSDNPTCWTSTFGAAAKNSAEQFQAKTP